MIRSKVCWLLPLVVLACGRTEGRVGAVVADGTLSGGLTGATTGDGTGIVDTPSDAAPPEDAADASDAQDAGDVTDVEDAGAVEDAGDADPDAAVDATPPSDGGGMLPAEACTVDNQAECQLCLEKECTSEWRALPPAATTECTALEWCVKNHCFCRSDDPTRPPRCPTGYREGGLDLCDCMDSCLPEGDENGCRTSLQGLLDCLSTKCQDTCGEFGGTL